MGLGQITFGGLASGLDTNAIVSSLVALERRPIQALESQRATEQSKVNLLGTFEGLVKSLQSKASELVGDFFSDTLTSSNEATATFTLGSGALEGTHTLVVSSLASADRYGFDGVTDPDAGLGAGTITFDYESDDESAGKESFSVTISAGSDSLNDVAAAINAQAGDAVTASVINSGTSASPSYQLVIAGRDTGADYTIDNLQVTGTAITGQTNLTAATNATIQLDNLTIQRSTNTFDDVLEGVSFTVHETTGGAATTFSVSPDPEGIKTKLQGFVDAYNSVVGFINKQSSYSEEGGAGGDLFGDSSLNTVKRTIHQALFDVDIAEVMEDEEGYSTLGLVGIDLQSDGTLKIDESQLDGKITANLEAFSQLFLREDEDYDPEDPNGEDKRGLLRRIDEDIEFLLKDRVAKNGGEPVLNPVTGKEVQIDGLFKARRGTLDKIIDSINDDIDRLERNVEKFEEDLVLRFANLEKIMSGLTAQSQYINQLPSFGRSA